MPTIKKEIERIIDQHAEDIADGAGILAETNPPRILNIAMAISGGRTLNIARACDIFYGNDPADSQTIGQAITRGIEAGSPYKSIDEILRAIESRKDANDYLRMALADESVTFNQSAGTTYSMARASLTNKFNSEVMPYIFDYLVVTVDGTEYEVPQIEENQLLFGGAPEDSYDVYPYHLRFDPDQNSVYIYCAPGENRTLQVKVEGEYEEI